MGKRSETKLLQLEEAGGKAKDNEDRDIESESDRNTAEKALEEPETVALKDEERGRKADASGKEKAADGEGRKSLSQPSNKDKQRKENKDDEVSIPTKIDDLGGVGGVDKKKPDSSVADNTVVSKEDVEGRSKTQE